MSNNTATRVINNNEFNIQIAVVDENGKAFDLPYDSVGQMCISNDISRYESRLIMSYHDRHFGVLSGVSANGVSAIGLTISTDTIRDSKGIQGIFIIDKLKVMEYSTDNVVYQIEAMLSDSQRMHQQLAYFTEAENPLVILKKLYKDAELDLDLNNAKSEQKILYISDTNDKLKDQAEKLLSIASSGKTGAYFAVFQFNTKSHTIINIGPKSFSESSKIKIPVYSAPSGIAGVKDNDRNNIITIRGAETYSASVSYPIYAKQTANMFDYAKRKWKTEITDISDIKKVFEAGSEVVFGYDVQERQKNYPLREQQLFAVDNSAHGMRLRNAVLFTDAIEIKVTGDLRLDAGSFIFIESSNSKQYKKFGGAWLISGIYHWFEKDSYTTSLILSRPFRNASKTEDTNG